VISGTGTLGLSISIFHTSTSRIPTSINPDISRSGVGNRTKTSRVSTSQITRVRETVVFAGGIEISLDLLGRPVGQPLFHTYRRETAVLTNWGHTEYR
jgi:hypothetical protein